MTDEYGYTREERQAILANMRAASQMFYGLAAFAGCHAFIEFTGLMNEFIKLCEAAEAQGLTWVHANVHGDVNLPFQPHHIEYLSEKLECIYSKRIQIVDERMYSLAEIEVAFRKEHHAVGELFFPYPEMGAEPEDCEAATQNAWESFREALEAKT